MCFLGIDLGSSSIKLALVDQNTGQALALIQEPKREMEIHAPKPKWAEQSPEEWWKLTCIGIKRLLKENGVDKTQIQGIGIAYQMHGLVMVDQRGKSIRNAIIWCDSRAVNQGEQAYQELGKSFCDSELLNSPANFTASKLKWVQQNEPQNYQRIYKVMLPGDYLAFRFSGECNTTVSGLSEGVFWNFKKQRISTELLGYYEISQDLLPEVVDTFSLQAKVSKKGAEESGLSVGTPILYRAGDQPNNALSLNVLKPGEIAATGGTSGVVYAVTDSLTVTHCDKVNNFAHVTYTPQNNYIGKLLCINGAGIQYRWLRQNLKVKSYDEMNHLAVQIPIGSEGLKIIPFGNGAERMLGNQTLGSHILQLDLNRHDKAHFCRATLEGIAFAFMYGFELMKSDGISPSVLRVGNDNLFRSPVFANTIASLIGQPIEVYNTTGAIGAARACVLQDKDFTVFATFMKKDYVQTYLPEENHAYQEAYLHWKNHLDTILKTTA